MEIGETLYVTQRGKWRRWLAGNYNKKKEIWLIYYRKSSGKKRISYNEAVEEALCYGWIDSTAKNIDNEKFAQRFTPRRKNSPLSEMNKERIRMMIRQKKMTDAGLKAVEKFFNKDEKRGKLVVSKEILKAIKENKKAWKNFKNFSETYKRIRLAYIEGQGRHSKDSFKRSLNNFIKKTEKNKKFGMMK